MSSYLARNPGDRRPQPIPTARHSTCTQGNHDDYIGGGCFYSSDNSKIYARGLKWPGGGHLLHDPNRLLAGAITMYLIGIWYRFSVSDSSVSYVSQARLSFCFLSSLFFHNTQSTCYKLLSMGFLRCTEHEAGSVAHGRDDIRKLLQRKGALSYRRHHMELDNKFLRPPPWIPKSVEPNTGPKITSLSLEPDSKWLVARGCDLPRRRFLQ